MSDAMTTNASIFDNENATCELLGVSRFTLRGWRARKVGPPYVKVGRQIRYNRESTLGWMRSRTVQTAAWHSSAEVAA